MQDQGVMRTGFDAITALGAALEKKRLTHGSGRAQPVRPHWRSRFLWRRVHMGRIFLRRFCDRQDGILEKIPAPVFRISRHD